MKKKNVLMPAMALAMACMCVPFTGCGKQVGEEVDGNRTQLYVGFYEGGWGRDWIEYLKTEFEKQYPDIQIMLSADQKYEFVSDRLVNTIKDDVYDIYFTDLYSHDFVKGESSENLLLDVTDVVTTPLKDVFAREVTLSNGKKIVAADQAAFANESKSIEQKMDADMQTYYKSSSKNGDKYFGIPHSGSTMNLNYDVDLFEEQQLYISSCNGGTYTWTGGLEGQPAKWKGQDGEAGTLDDGLPVTYEDFKALCRQIAGKNMEVLTFGQDMSTYRQHYLATVWAQYVGAEEFSLGYSQSGTSQELGITINDTNAHRLQESQGKKAMLQLAYDFAHTPGWLSEGSKTDSYTLAQQNFINSKYDADKRIAMILEGSWWENEAKATLEANKANGKETGERRFGVMTVPFFNGTDGITNQTSTDKTVVVRSADVGAYVRSNAKEPEIAKQFMAFAILDANLRATTRISGEIKPYSYELTAEDKAQMSYYQLASWDVIKGSASVPTRLVGPSTMMKNNRQYFSGEWICEGKDADSKSWTDPFRLFREDSAATVDAYWSALKYSHKQKWEDENGLVR